MIAQIFTALLCTAFAFAAYDHGVDLPTTLPLNVAHRGSSGSLPEHTVQAYQRAIDEGADVIECDMCLTRDMHIVCLHESMMNSTTDVATKFPDRFNTYFVIDKAQTITDYFTVDFTLDELKTLGVRQRMGTRDPNYNYLYPIATLEEAIGRVQNAGRPVGLYLETKDPKWVNSLEIVVNASTTFEDLVIGFVSSYGYTSASSPCFLQSFDRESIRYFSGITQLPLVQLTSVTVTNETLQEWAAYCYGIGPSKGLIAEVDPRTGYIRSVSDLIARAHAYGLRVHPYTFRNEYQYLAWDYRIDPHLEYQQFLDLGVDGYFTDFPGTLHRFLNSTS